MTQLEYEDSIKIRKKKLKENKNLTCKFYYELSQVNIEDNFLIGNDKIRKKEIIIPIDKVSKILRIYKKQILKEIRLYTFSKQIYIKTDNLDEISKFLNSILKTNCKQIEERFD